MSFIIGYLKPYRKRLLLCLLLAAINQIFSLLDPQVFRRIVDNYVTKINLITQDQFFRGILLGTGAMVGVAMISRIAKNFQDFFVNTMTQRISMKIFYESLTHAFWLPYKKLEDYASGQILGNVNKAKDDIKLFIENLINVVFFSLIGVIFVLCYAFRTHRLVGTLYLVMMPLMMATFFVLSQKIKQAQSAIVAQTAQLGGSTTETLRNISLVKSLGLEEQQLSRVKEVTEGIVDLELKKIKYVRTIEFIQGTLINAIRVGLLATMFWLVFNKELTLGEFMTLFFYSFYIFGPLYQFGTVIKNYQEAKASNELLQNILKTEMVPAGDGEIVNEVKSIAFNDVSFGYEADRAILKNVNFTLKPGETIAFVGPSGAGKTSIIKLVCALYLPTQGSIMVNTVDQKTINTTSLKNRIGLVSQESQLFSGTIADNLRFVHPEASDQECMAVVEQAALKQFLTTLPEGLATKIGEGGLKLSGGQKQRLAIARALLRAPDVLIFDEATSSLDSMTEHEITQTLKEISMKNKEMLVIMIAHRLSTVMHADRIYVLEEGTIVETGAHDKLLEQKGLYFAMCREQGLVH